MNNYTNNIKAELTRCRASASEYLSIVIDGKSLDDILDVHYPNEDYSGLVPTLLSWLDNEEERKIVWDRIDKNDQIVPILMCPDDCDLYCVVVVAECFIKDSLVIWNRLGLDATLSKDFSPDRIGSTVRWLEKIKPFIFAKNEYTACIETFRSALAN